MIWPMIFPIINVLYPSVLSAVCVQCQVVVQFLNFVLSLCVAQVLSQCEMVPYAPVYLFLLSMCGAFLL